MPGPAVARRSIEVSGSLSGCGTEFTLDDVKLFGHLSMYMGSFEPAGVPAAVAALRGIAARTPPLPLVADRYTQDVEQGMIEVTYRESAAASRLQEMVVAALNPLRVGLREADPVGHRISDWLPTTTGETRHNLETYGYDEIGGLFRPHITFTRFVQRGRRVDLGALPPVAGFSGTFSRLGLYEMGEHGTCTRAVADVELGP